MRRFWWAQALVVLALPASAQPPAKAVVHPTAATAVPLAQAAAAARDYRVYLDVGLAVRETPGLTCADPRASSRLVQRGWNEVPDTPEPPHIDAPREAAELFNRTLAADKGFRAATGCRPLNACETRFGPVIPGNFGWRAQGPGFRLDRQCLDHPGQLIAAVQGGSLKDVDLLLARAPAAWRRKDAAGRDVYDRALIEAANKGRRDVLVRLLAKVQTGRAPITAPERPIETAMVAALAPAGRRDAEEALAMGRLLRAHGARLAYRKGVNVSLLSEVIAHSASHAPQRLKVVDWLLAIGADPNGPPCAASRAGGEQIRGFEPLYWAVDDEPVFDRLVAAGARIRDPSCKTDDQHGGRTLTWHAINGLKNLGSGFEEQRRIAVKLLKMGGRAREWGQYPVSITGGNPPAMSIIVAAAQLDGWRDPFLNAVIDGSGSRPESAPAARLAQAWLTCRHGDAVLLPDRALLCAGEQ